MASTPNYAATPVIGMAQISTANTNRDGTGTLGAVLAGAAGGRRIHTIRIKATGNTTAGMIRLYLYDGTNTRMFTEVVVPVITVGASTPAFEATLSVANGALPPDFQLPSATWELRASTHNGEAFNVIAMGDDA